VHGSIRVDADQVHHVILQKNFPGRRGWFLGPHHVFFNGRFGRFDAELAQRANHAPSPQRGLAMDVFRMSTPPSAGPMPAALTSHAG